MAEAHLPQGPFDIPDVSDFVPRRLKPWIFIFFVLIIQFSGGVYLAAASDMVGTTALMQEDILMAGYASLIGMAINFAVMFRIKFRFSNRTQLLAACIVLIAANFICASTDSVPVLVITCFVAGWFRMQATFACNSTIQLWLTPVRDMAIFFCYVYIVVDSVIQLSGIATIYTAFFSQWEYMQWIMSGLLALMMILVLILVKPVRTPMFIPLLGIDWIGAGLWAVFMTGFTFICVYGNFYDWWDSVEIRVAALVTVITLGINLYRASFLHHPYISFMAMKNRNVVRATVIYTVFFTLLATEHVFEHTYAAQVLGFDETNLIDLNWYCRYCHRLRIYLFHVCVAEMALQDHDRYRLRACDSVSCLFLFLFGLRGGKGDAVYAAVFPRGGSGDNIYNIPDLDSAERTAVSGVSSGTYHKWFHRCCDERDLRSCRSG